MVVNATKSAFILPANKFKYTQLLLLLSKQFTVWLGMKISMDLAGSIKQ